ncbi:helix-turn-helix transcriptional regulator [Streptomyces sp. NPDC048110]|uniref:helix-turn-helix transcriptional regulator n=1 Tax=Streptomyces sp. NPDC048110 TaxID=3155483 RepID=UPI0033EA139F
MAEVLDQLQAMGLLCKAVNDAEKLVPVSPECAAAQALLPMQQEARDLQASMDQVRAELEKIHPVYVAARDKWLQTKALEVLPTRGAVRSTLAQLGAECTTEMLTSQPGGRLPAALKEAPPQVEAMLRRGVRMRTLYQQTARYDPSTVTYVEQVAPHGPEVRTLSEPFERFIVFDRKTMVMPYQGDPESGLLVQERSLVDFAVATFERAWLSAVPFTTEYRKEYNSILSSKVQLSIMRMLVSGLDDQAIARRLGMGLRSCQRHVATIMKKLGARSRLHAGYLIARSGLLTGADREDYDESPDGDPRHRASFVDAAGAPY